MKKRSAKAVASVEPEAPASEPRPRSVVAPTRGVLEAITPEGFVLVTWDGREPRPVELATNFSDRALLRAIEARAPVLIDFLDGDAETPVVVGLLRARLDVDATELSSVTERAIELTAGESLSLRCGQSAIELRSDGRVMIRGAELRSVATGGNCIQGAHVDIN